MEKIILPVILFVLTMTITPGPNNMLLTASGAQFGFKRSLPFIIGIVLGILSQLLLSALGLGILFNRFPIIQNILKISGSLYILFLAIKIAFPRSDKSDETQKNRPMSLLQGAAFQYLNPKAYIMTITAMSVYPLEGELFFRSAGFILLSFLIICPLSISLWAGFGSILKKWIKEGKYKRFINYFLGVLTAVSVVFIIH